MPATMTVLIVDDEHDVQLLFELHFEDEIENGEMAFHFALSGDEALNWLNAQNKTDLALILSDINMPDMDGLELLGKLKNQYPEISVMMVTAYGDEATRAKAHNLGCDDYITKPIDFSGLKEKILNILN